MKKFGLICRELRELVFIALIISVSSSSDISPPIFDWTLPIEENIDSYVSQLIRTEYQPGLSIAVVKDEVVVVRKNYGFSDLSRGVLVSSDTSFYLGSVSKQFTSMAIMILVERGLLSFETKLASFLIDSPNNWNDITVHHLLTHQSGLPDYFRLKDFSLIQVTNAQVLSKLIKNHNLDFTVGTKYKYSNSGYIALAHIVEMVSSQSFNVFVKENIFDLIDMMNSIVYDETKPEITGRAIGYADGANQISDPNKLNDYDLLTMGDGGIYSTINDLIKWDQALYTEIIVTKESLAKAYTGHVSENYGYGWGVYTRNGKKLYYHNGRLAGYRTAIGRFPEQNLTILLLSNGSYDWASDLHSQIMNYYTH